MSAIISSCGRYRYQLERDGPGEGVTAIIMVNPSTADAETDDHTIRKLRGFGERNQWGRLMIGNLFAYRATDVRELGKVRDPVGPDNDHYLAGILGEADRVIVAWGPVTKQPPLLRGRWETVPLIVSRQFNQPLYCIGAPTKSGHPCHPLTLGYDRPIIRWNPPV